MVKKKNKPANQEMQVQYLGQEDLQKEEMATHSSILACERISDMVFDFRR